MNIDGLTKNIMLREICVKNEFIDKLKTRALEHDEKSKQYFKEDCTFLAKEEYDKIASGDFKEIVVEDGLFIFKRQNKKQTVYVFVNNCSKSYTLKLNKKFKELLKNEEFENEINIQPYSYGILK